MRALLGFLLVVSLAVSPAMAGTNGSDANATPASSTSSNSSSAAQPAAAATPAAKPAASASSMESELEELRDQMDSQARQIQEQNDQLKAEQLKMKDLEEKLKAANSGAAASTSSPALNLSAGSSSNVTMASLATPSSSSRPTPIAAAPQNGAIPDAPLQFHLGSAYITPLGFMDFTGVGRTTNAGNGIGSNFGSIPYAFTNAGGAINLPYHATEARFSMQNSRIGLRVDAMVKGAHVIGYLEADFLGNNAGSVAVTSNSNTLRSRLYWVDVTKDKWEILAGQTWSLITPNRAGISPLPGNVFFSNDTDVNYQLGLVWGRIPEFRFVYHPSSKMALAFALDQNEPYDGGSGGGASVTLPTGPTVVGGVSALPGSQLNNGGTTVNAPQVFPDLIVKAAFDPSPKFHIEAGGVERQFRVVVNSTSAATSPIVNKTATGGGVFVNLNFQLFKGMRILTNNYASDGGGRYIFGLAPDVVVNPDGSLQDIEASSTVDGLEYTHGNTLLYSYYSAMYINRNISVVNLLDYGYGVDATGAAGNYGNAIAQNRAIQEATIGFNQTIWKDAKYGAFNFMGQYSYIQRDPWSTAAGQPKHAPLSIAFINLRYTLPGGAPSAAQLK